MIICDRGYLKHQRLWRDRVARKASCRVAQVKSDVVVPLETVSPKAEYAARTFRPKIQKHLDDYLIEIKPVKVQHPNVNHSFDGLEWKRPADILSLLNIDGTVPDVTRFFKGGTSRAKKIFGNFIRARLKNYEKNHNQPQTDDISHMSMYLHFGQISPLYLALKINKAVMIWIRPRHLFWKNSSCGRNWPPTSFIIIRSMIISIAFRNGQNRRSRTIERTDGRITYTRRQLEDVKTHDPYWNGAMQAMKYTGFMHNYMRMYWGKKILEWSSSPERAFRNTLAMNNKYFLDGWEPNSYAGVA